MLPSYSILKWGDCMERLRPLLDNPAAVLQSYTPGLMLQLEFPGTDGKTHCGLSREKQISVLCNNTSFIYFITDYIEMAYLF
jgi:hypothetical protein